MINASTILIETNQKAYCVLRCNIKLLSFVPSQKSRQVYRSIVRNIDSLKGKNSATLLWCSDAAPLELRSTRSVAAPWVNPNEW